jgi:predicted amidophosphoribosyltransferase
VGLDYDSRLANVQGAFTAQEGAAEGRTVLLVDDVCTTGATLQACSEALTAAGAQAVYGITLARTI